MIWDQILHYVTSSFLKLYRGSKFGPRLSKPRPAHLQWWKAHAMRPGTSGSPTVSATLRWLVVCCGQGGLHLRTPLLGGGGGRAGLAARCVQGIRCEAGFPLTQQSFRLPDPPFGEGCRSESPDGARHPAVTEPGAQESRCVFGLWAGPAVLLWCGEALPPVHLQWEVHRGTVPRVWDCGGCQRPGDKTCRCQTAVPLLWVLPLELNCVAHRSHSSVPILRVCDFVLVQYWVNLNLLCCLCTWSLTLSAGCLLRSGTRTGIFCIKASVTLPSWEHAVFDCLYLKMNILRLSKPPKTASFLTKWTCFIHTVW